MRLGSMRPALASMTSASLPGRSAADALRLAPATRGSPASTLDIATSSQVIDRAVSTPSMLSWVACSWIRASRPLRKLAFNEAPSATNRITARTSATSPSTIVKPRSFTAKSMDRRLVGRVVLGLVAIQ